MGGLALVLLSAGLSFALAESNPGGASFVIIGAKRLPGPKVPSVSFKTDALYQAAENARDYVRAHPSADNVKRAQTLAATAQRKGRADVANVLASSNQVPVHLKGI